MLKAGSVKRRRSRSIGFVFRKSSGKGPDCIGSLFSIPREWAFCRVPLIFAVICRKRFQPRSCFTSFTTSSLTSVVTGTWYIMKFVDTFTVFIYFVAFVIQIFCIFYCIVDLIQSGVGLELNFG